MQIDKTDIDDVIKSAFHGLRDYKECKSFEAILYTLYKFSVIDIQDYNFWTGM